MAMVCIVKYYFSKIMRFKACLFAHGAKLRRGRLIPIESYYITVCCERIPAAASGVRARGPGQLRR